MPWDFSVATSIRALLRTWPFILARMLVYTLVAVAYVLATGTGATVGWGIGAFGSPGFRAGATFWGGAVGFAIVSVFLYLVREWFLYMLKAGHIAVLVAVLDARPVATGLGQIPYAHGVVQARFLEANVLFVVDQLVKGVVRAVTGIVDVAAAILPLPGLAGLARFARAVVRIAIGFVDEVILAYNIRVGPANPYRTAQDALVLFAQNGAWILKNAAWLAAIVWGLAFLLFLAFLAPAAAILYAFPGALSNLGFVLAIVFALCVKAAVLEPFAIASLMQVYFRAIEGQAPREDWHVHLDEVSARFRALGEKARDHAAPPPRPARRSGAAGDPPPSP